LGPSGTGKTVFLKTLVGLLWPESGKIIVDGFDIDEATAKELNEVRTLFGMVFQDGALFGSMNLYDNTASPLRGHTRKKRERDPQHRHGEARDGGPPRATRNIPQRDLRRHAQACRPGARFGAGATAILCDDAPDSGLDPVRTVYLSQLLHHYL
jgi:phospholipid/cholesterol/gamma-HCH transport system ATP-binding protein